MNGLQTKNHLRNAIEHNGGFTWSPFREVPDSGFMVGMVALVKMPDNDFPLTDGQLKLALEWIQSNPKNTFLGGWKNPETNEVFYDISVWYPTKDQALTEAAIQNEIAIFDITNQKDIKVSEEL